MDIQIVEKQKMEALKSLAETNLAVSDIKNQLNRLRIDEGRYIEEREAMVLKQIEKVVTESREVLSEAYKNYQHLHEVAVQAAQSAKFLEEAHVEFQKVQRAFHASSQVVENRIEKAQKALDDSKKQAEIEKELIVNTKESLERTRKELVAEKIRLVDERETLERAMGRLQNKK